jgi:GNAT superfamily N-acetyltransferase
MANVKRYDRMPTVGHAGGSWGYVGNVFVLAPHRNAGLGDALMQHVAAWAWSMGMQHLRLAPSPASTSFYARLGFEAGSVVELNPPMT